MRSLKNYIHFCLAIIANLYYRFPAKELTVIGVTGTDGKTTTTSLIYHLLQTAGKKTAMITSVGAYIGESVYDIGFHVTTPSPFAIQKYLRKAVDQGYTHVVLEVTSHALDQNRPWGIQFRIGVLTNISNEHLDYHKTYEQYVAAKAKLFLFSSTSVINKDDRSYSYILPYLPQESVITYSLYDSSATYLLKKTPISVSFIGDFNRSNAMAAVSVCRQLDISFKTIQKGLDSFSLPPGRQEIIQQDPFFVMIDFAHTPNAFSQLLPEMKKKTKKRLIHVFGSAGKRDKTKRPEMGKFSASSADIIILTAEDPRDESVESINASIAQGIPDAFVRMEKKEAPLRAKKLLFQIADRKEAICCALSLAQPGDSVVITGKGHETSMNYGDGEIPWNEHEVVMQCLQSYY